MRLFMPDDQPLEELIENVPSPSSNFRHWIGTLFRQQGGEAVIEDILKAVIRAGLAKDRLSGLQYLNELSAKQSPRKILVACSDLLGQKHYRQFSRLRKILEPQTINELGDPFRFYGIASHQAMYDLATGKLPDFHFIEKVAKLFSADKLSVSDADLFSKHSLPVQVPLFETGEISLLGSFLAGVSRENKISDELRAEIKLTQKRFLGKISVAQNWMEVVSSTRADLNELLARLFSVFGPHIDTLLKYKGAYADYLLTITLLSWASAVGFYYKKEPLLFREVKILPKDLRSNF